MALFAPHIVTPDSALGGKVIEKSLRWNGHLESTHPQLRRTGTTTSSSFTISMWAKLSRVSDQYRMFFSIGQENDANAAWVGVQDGQNMGFQGGNGTYTTITRMFRDPTSWFHFLISVNSNNFTVYIDGTSVQTGTMRSLDTSTNGIRIGVNYGNFYPWNGYLADVYFIDGQAKAPTDFAYTESQTGMWRPKQYTGTFGTSDAHLEFKDSSSVAALGKDTSGNGNDFSVTTDGFNVTAGSGNDSSEDTPSNNFCTLNPVDLGSGTLINGNLQTYPLNAGYAVRGTNFVSSGKWYFEFVVTAGTNMPTYALVGIQRDSGSLGSYSGTINIPDGYGLLLFGSTSYLYNGTTATTYNIGATSFNDVIGVAFDLDKGEIYFYRDGSLLGGGAPAYSNITQGNYAPHVSNQTTSNNDMECFVNFGQRPFAHTPPTGYRALNSRNLATPSAASVVRPQRHFDCLLYTGNNNTSQNITGLEFQPDLVWIKNRDNVERHHLVDSVRGNNKVLFSDEADGERTGSHGNGHTQLNLAPKGFNLVSNGTNDELNFGTRTYVAWCWKAGGAAVSNSDGSITSSVSVNQEAGFSILLYTGTGSLATIGHGLNGTPEMIWTKSRSTTGSWGVLDTVVNTTAENRLHLNDNGGYSSYQGYKLWGDTVPTSSVFTVREDASTNASGVTYVAYCWRSIPGYSKIGTYTGNASTDGTYVHLGFRPAFVLLKRTSASAAWVVHDNKRSGSNPDNDYLHPDINQAESDGSSGTIDFLSNGFKLRMTAGTHNDGTFIYMAFAERPSGTMFGLDANAR